MPEPLDIPESLPGEEEGDDGLTDSQRKHLSDRYMATYGNRSLSSQERETLGRVIRSRSVLRSSA